LNPSLLLTPRGALRRFAARVIHPHNFILFSAKLQMVSQKNLSKGKGLPQEAQKISKLPSGCRSKIERGTVPQNKPQAALQVVTWLH
jgi:hypothetical protein